MNTGPIIFPVTTGASTTNFMGVNGTTYAYAFGSSGSIAFEQDTVADILIVGGGGAGGGPIGGGGGAGGLIYQWGVLVPAGTYTITIV